ncbi:efflux transporter periplasmic adaptor subunit [Sphingorhabdus lutea]|uniref:Efflux transporter periplasmic adaptor subunit n=1 Tax=Sphingorhabdus lutea TaxID=1913578 RepID=A0A1L3JDU0_9SPHN|nr:efflux RND transporter periplasmic adaptor subunit [Sphingorhabdus lutea]APG63276.1 efflux transporter periplasmic adaptor subunit [Sphingorhabdus lutea]
MNFEANDMTQNNYESPFADEDVKRKRKMIIIIAIVLVSIIAAAFIAIKMQGGTSADEAEKPADGQGQQVTIITAQEANVDKIISATGTIAAKREIPIGVVGEGGLVARVYADAGDWVKQGQVLVSVDRAVQSQSLNALRAQSEISRADLQLAENELNRAKQLVDRGFISKADIDRKTAARNSAAARLRAAQAQIGELQARNARLDIRAPSSGYILERNVEVGQTISQGGAVIFRMAQGGEMEVEAMLGESDLSALGIGVPAQVTPVGTSEAFSGRIWQISPTINPQTRQGMARVALPFNTALRPGGFASVNIRAGTITAPILPESAIQNDKQGPFVYIVGAENKVERRNIKTGAVTANGLAVTSGLNGNEKIVLRAGGFLNPGEKVRPVALKSGK